MGFRGTSGIDIDLRRVDIDQCAQRRNSSDANIFAGSDKCKERTTKVSARSGRRWKSCRVYAKGTWGSSVILFAR